MTAKNRAVRPLEDLLKNGGTVGVVETPLADRLHCLTYLERAVLRLLIEHANEQAGGVTFLGQQGLAQLLNSERARVIEAQRMLLERGFIETEKRPGKSSITTIIYPAIVDELQRTPGVWESVPKMTRKRFEQLPRPSPADDEPMF